MAAPNPILVTGSHNSGTTWVGRMLALSPKVVYLHEPLNMTTKIGKDMYWDIDPDRRYWYTYITPANEQGFRIKFKRLIKVFNRYPSRQLNPLVATKTLFTNYLFGRRALLKDPFAIFSVEWFKNTFNTEVVILIRHPAAFAESLQRRNWHFSFTNLLDQKELMEEHLGAYTAEVTEFTEHQHPIIEQAALLWKLIYQVVMNYQSANLPYLFLRHEDLSRASLREFERLYQRLGLEFTDHIADQIEAHSRTSATVDGKRTDSITRNSQAIIDKWKTRLSDQEISKIRALVEPIASQFYAEEDWSQPIVTTTTKIGAQ